MDQSLQTIIINNGIGVGCSAAMLWLLWFRETRTIPTMIKAFDEANKRSMDSLTRIQHEMQEGFSIRNTKALETFAELVREERGNYQRWHEENRGRLDTLSREVRDNRHMIKNLHHSLGLKQAIDSSLSERKDSGE